VIREDDLLECGEGSPLWYFLFVLNWQKEKYESGDPSPHSKTVN
jgi:hypothetical protein